VALALNADSPEHKPRLDYNKRASVLVRRTCAALKKRRLKSTRIFLILGAAGKQLSSVNYLLN
jgi:hypothetical protein